MKIYLVGGAVRNTLLGLPVTEKDWVVVGGSVSEMVKKGFRQVGKSFPVFLHPETNEEYALARTERKVGPGYKGFEFNATESVTLEEDLQRRDLTVNAIAEAQNGELIDPYHGMDDIKAGILRHVSPAFIEDPVRLLRIARFSAQFHQFHFKIAPETLRLMVHMVEKGEVDHLVPERVWHELSLALKSDSPKVFFDVLSACHAMPVLFPQLSDLQALERAAVLTDDISVRFATLFLSVDRDAVNAFCRLYKIPKAYQDLAALSVSHFATFQAALTLTAQQVLDLLQVADAFRREHRFEKFLLVCQLFLGGAKQQAAKLRKAYQLSKSVSIKPLIESGKTGLALAQSLHQERLLLLTSNGI